MQISPTPKTSFQGIAPPYKIVKGIVYPISKCAEKGDILKISQIKYPLPMGEGRSGIVFDLKDFVLKVFKRQGSSHSAGKRWYVEVKNLDYLRDLCIKNKNPNYLHNTQKGLFGLKLFNKFYLLSSKVEGNNPNHLKNKFNKKNLSALVEILERMDKGMDGETFLHTDLRAANVMITDNDAGLIDFGSVVKIKIRGEKSSNWIDQSEYSNMQKFMLKLFTSDTGFNVGNLRSFEYDLLAPYLSAANKDEATKVFDLFMKLKADYHGKMSKFYLEEFNTTANPDFKLVSREEQIHSRLLKALPDDIKETEIDRMQINIMLRKVLNILKFKMPAKVNMSEVFQYFNSIMNNLSLKIQKSVDTNDCDRICYYNNFKARMIDYSEFIYDAINNSSTDISQISTQKHSLLLKDKLK